MDHEATLTRLTDLISALATTNPLEAQRIAAHAVAITLRRGGATVDLGEYAGFTSAEVKGYDGRRMIIVPLYDWDPEDETPGRWEYAVRDTDGTLLARPDGDDTHGCSSIWHVANHGLDLYAGADDQHTMQRLMGKLLDWMLVLGENDPLGRVTPGQPATDYAVDPYPGQRPYGSFVIDRAGDCWPVTVDEDQASGWVVEGEGGVVCLDTWLREHSASPLSERVPLLGYGSNASPGKVMANETPLPSVHLACTIEDLASVWCFDNTGAGRTPVTLDHLPGHVEEAVVMMCDLDELNQLDGVEGRSSHWYDLVLLETGRVVLENGAHIPHPAAYIGARTERHPMHIAGKPVLRVDIDHDEVRVLRSTANPTVGNPRPLGTTLRAGTYPHPGQCVPSVFVYGTLRPGQQRWPALEPYVVAEPIPASVTGQVLDSGYGYPVLTPAADSKVPGVLCPCRPADMATLLARLDEIEGVAHHLFHRHLRNVDGSAAWVYVDAQE